VNTKDNAAYTFLGFMLTFSIYASLTYLFYTISISAGTGGLSPLYLSGDDGNLYLLLIDNFILTGQNNTSLFYIDWMGSILNFLNVSGVLSIRLINVIPSLLTVSMVYFFLIRKNLPTQKAFFLTIFLAIYPSKVYFEHISIYRDSWITFLFVFSAFRFLYIIEAKSILRKAFSLFLLAISTFFLFKFRAYSAISLIVSIVFYLFFASRFFDKIKKNTIFLASVYFLTVLAMIYILKQGILGINVEEFRNGYQETEARSNLGIDFFDSPLLLSPIVFIYSLISNAVGPLPNQINNGFALIIFLTESLFVSMMIYRIYKNRIEIFKDNSLLFLFILGILYISFVSIFNDNVGNASRLRIPFFVTVYIVYWSINIKSIQKVFDLFYFIPLKFLNSKKIYAIGKLK
jgi:hypothetical protein